MKAPHLKFNPSNVISEMTSILKHRGPDDEGIYINQKSEVGSQKSEDRRQCNSELPIVALGHRRLSIIDLSPAGHQPMCNEDGNIWITYNGEIYNYREIKNELISKGHIFRSNTDTEVIIHAYEEYGTDCLYRFNGMFAFAIWDERDKRLFLARDRIGIKPLYYANIHDGLVFASEIKSILMFPSFNKEPYYESIFDFLTHQTIFGDKTCFKNVRMLLPGYYMTGDSRGFSINKYWELEFVKEHRDESFFINRFKELFFDSVLMRLMSDVPVGTYLSGGIDSSSVTMVSNMVGQERLQSFTGAFLEGGRFDERDMAREVTKKLGIENHEIIIRPSDFIKNLGTITYHLDEPRPPSGAFPVFMVSLKAREHVKVVLTGHGGDELFAGYPASIPIYIRLLLSSSFSQNNLSNLMKLPTFLRKGLASLGLYRLIGYFLYSYINPGMKNNFNASFLGKRFFKYLTDDFIDTGKRYRPYDYHKSLLDELKDHDLFDRMMFIYLKNYITILLILEDKMDMANSIEGRVPFLDHRLVQFATTIPSEIKIRDMELKHIIRASMKEILPPPLFKHKKQGFPVPLNIWFKKELKDFLEDLLFSKRVRERGIFNTKRIKRLLFQNNLGIMDRKQEMWNFMMTEMWFRIFFDENF